MPETPTAETTVPPLPPLPPLISVPAFWPMVMAGTLAKGGTELLAKNIKFVEEDIKIHEELRPKVARPTAFASICGPWCCATMGAAFRAR